MNSGQLAAALRSKAAEVRTVNVDAPDDVQHMRDAVTLLRVLASVVEGKSLAKAFGPAGDWGYQSQIGAAIAAAEDPPKP